MARILLNEEPGNGDAEGAGEPVEDVEVGINGAAFDFGDCLPADPGCVGKYGLREPSSGSLEREVPTYNFPRRRSDSCCLAGHLSIFAGAVIWFSTYLGTR